MGLFGRGRGKDRAEAVKDASLPMLTEDEAARLRSLVREVAAELGREVTVHAGHVADDSGSEFGLWNLGAICAAEKPARWRDVVVDHLGRLFHPTDPDVDSLTADELLEAVHARLVEAGQLDQLGGPDGHALAEFAPGVVHVVAVDLPQTVAMPSLESLGRTAPVSTLADRAWRNTRSLLDSEDLDVEKVAHDGRWFQCLLGDSFFTASLALMLPDVAARTEPGVEAAHGILFCLPNRHQLGVRVVADGHAAVDALMTMPHFALWGYREGAGPVSPHVYHWADGQVTCLTSYDEDGTVTVSPGPVLTDLMNEDAGRED